VTTEFSQENKDGSNVWFYVNIGIGAELANILDGFITQFGPSLAEAASTNMTYTQARARDLFVPGSAISQEIGLVGTQPLGGTDMPFFTTIPLTLLHDEPGVNTGSKRFSGMTESYTDDGIVLNNNGLGQAAFLENVVVSQFGSTAPDITIMEPVVVGRLDDGFGGYRLPETEAEALARGFGIVTGTNVQAIGHQTTRKE
jgi:hypothetical protein